MKLFVRNGGIIKALDVEPTLLKTLGTVHVERAGHVEFDNERQAWTVSFPDGSCLPGTFGTRQDALRAEVEEVTRRLRGQSGTSLLELRRWYEWEESEDGNLELEGRLR